MPKIRFGFILIKTSHEKILPANTFRFMQVFALKEILITKSIRAYFFDNGPLVARPWCTLRVPVLCNALSAAYSFHYHSSIFLQNVFEKGYFFNTPSSIYCNESLQA